MIDVRLVTQGIVLALAREAAGKHGLRTSDVMNGRGDRRSCNARKEVYKALREGGWSLPRIARAFGRDHTTIIHALSTESVVLPPKPEKRSKIALPKPAVLCTPDDIFKARMGLDRYENVPVKASKRTLSWCYD